MDFFLKIDKRILLFISCLAITFTSKSQLGFGLEAPQVLELYSPSVGLSANSNDDYKVEIKRVTDFQWQEAFVYSTYVNKEGELAYPDGNKEESSFVNFDFNGKINIKITCNTCIANNTPITNVIVRPKSYLIPTIINNFNKTISFDLDSAVHEFYQLSVELNGNRYNGVHLFANPPDDLKPSGIGGGPSDDYTTADWVNSHLENRPFSNLTNEYFYVAQDNETIYIDGNDVIRGGILINNKHNVSIIGRGIIDNQGFDKKYTQKDNQGNTYPVTYDYVSGIAISGGSTNTNVDGIIINDVQNGGVRINDADGIIINNLKSITHTLWGAGIYIARASDLDINNCFLRTSDDSLPFYPMRDEPPSHNTDGDTFDIQVNNTILYADVARPVQIGVHGRYSDIHNRAKIENIHFKNVDILDHDNSVEDFDGAISIQCADYNYCQDISFENIRIEKFTNGSLFKIIVEKGLLAGAVTEGFRTQNIKFKNISYQTDFNEKSSVISGLPYSNNPENCYYVNGVHFENFTINGSPINSIADYHSNNTSSSKFNIGPNVYDLTFNNPIIEAQVAPGKYFITSKFDNKYLNISNQSLDQNASFKHALTAPWLHEWQIIESGDGYYYIKSNYDGTHLGGTINENYNNYECHGEFVITKNGASGDDRTKWAFVDLGNNEYRIINKWLGSSSLVHSSIASDNGQQYVGTAPWINIPRQKWKLQPTRSINRENEFVRFYPNVANNELNIDVLNYKNIGSIKYSIYSIYEAKVVSGVIKNSHQKINVENLENGIYIIEFKLDGVIQTEKLIIKN